MNNQIKNMSCVRMVSCLSGRSIKACIALPWCIGKLAKPAHVDEVKFDMAATVTVKKPKLNTQADDPWSVIVLDDPVNLMGYVTMVFKRVFGYDDARAETLMHEVHNQGRSVVWSGAREKAEFYAQQLHGWQLRAMIEKMDA